MRSAAHQRDDGARRRPTRAALVAAARITFTDLGVSATLADIAGYTGVDLEALQREFDGRDGLVAAVLDDLTASLRSVDDDGRDAAGFALPEFRLPRVSLKHVVPPVAAVAAMLPLGISPAAAATVTPAVVNAAPPAGTTVLTISPIWPVVPLDGALSGAMCDGGCRPVRYMPFFTAGGVGALQRQLTTDQTARPAGSDPTVVLAFSNGALVAQRWLEQHAGDPNAPTPDQLSFVFVGNPRRAYGGSMPALPPTDYHVVDVVRQYDPLADFPDHPFNLLALANIAAGIFSPEHLNYTQVNLNDPNNVVWTEGNTTYVFVPTPDLPLLAPLRLLGMTKLADHLNAPLQAIIEKAYDRPYLPQPAEPDPAPAKTQATVTTAAVERVTVETTAASEAVATEAAPSTGRHRLTVGRHAAPDAGTDPAPTDSETTTGKTDPSDSGSSDATADTGSDAGGDPEPTGTSSDTTTAGTTTDGAADTKAAASEKATKATPRVRSTLRDTTSGKHRLTSAAASPG